MPWLDSKNYLQDTENIQDWSKSKELDTNFLEAFKGKNTRKDVLEAGEALFQQVHPDFSEAYKVYIRSIIGILDANPEKANHPDVSKVALGEIATAWAKLGIDSINLGIQKTEEINIAANNNPRVYKGTGLELD